jgi:hypothetical protein
MVCPKGFEPLTLVLEVPCSIQLSYGHRVLLLCSLRLGLSNKQQVVVLNAEKSVHILQLFTEFQIEITKVIEACGNQLTIWC